MTAKQTSTYWRKWSAVRKVLVEMGEFAPKEADDQRKIIQRDALGGIDKSSKSLTNRDLDKVLDAFDRVLVLTAGPSAAPSRSETQPRARLLHAIDQLGLDAPYIEAISEAQFKTRDWRALSEADLTRFRFTLTARARSRSAR